MRSRFLRYALSWVVLPGVFLFSCRPADPGLVDAEVARILAHYSAESVYDALLELTQRAPANGCVALHLGRSALQQNHSRRAEIHLQHAAEAGIGADCPGGPALLDQSAGEAALAQGAYAAALRYADAAIRNGARDSALLLKARASVGLQQFDGAVESYRALLPQIPPQDWDAYVGALVSTGDLLAAVAVLGQRRLRFGYLPGQGTTESWLYQQLGEEALSVAAALLEIEYLRYHRLMPDEVVQQNLGRLRAVVEDPAALQLLEAFGLFVDQRWDQAASRLLAIQPRLEHILVDYAMAVALLRSGRGEQDQLWAYTALEPAFIVFQAYYYHLWMILSAAAEGYSLLTARELLEHTILLSPGSAAAQQSRRELGRLLGLTAEQAELLLLGQELDALAQRAVHYGDPQLLDAVIESLQLPQSVYTVAATLTLTRLAGYPVVRDYLAAAATELDDPTAGVLRHALGSRD
ncbi:MAG: hypothetical protein EA404_12285 [Spirochaetaceae bacterium]|nr:MAG: hypothetical protein EA404_12285 [Spirochaetaceae bacterium]